MLQIKNLQVRVKDSEENEGILRGLNLNIKPGELHCLMGPNGSGKSTLAFTLMGHPNYEATDGEILFDGKNILELEPHERAQLGIFLSFQYPSAIPGVSLESLMRSSYAAIKGEEVNPLKFRNKILKPLLKELNIPVSFLERYANEGFSGGEKKKAEILQMAILQPKLIVLDETDSGLDVDALKLVCEQVNKHKEEAGVLVITHYPRILEYLNPDYIHVIKEGKIALSGEGKSLAHEIEEQGYAGINAQ